jgi:hypothetical protein
MTVDKQKFDPRLRAHSSVVIHGVCHAVVGTGETECGREFSELEYRPEPREEYFEEKMCELCWPSGL